MKKVTLKPIFEYSWIIWDWNGTLLNDAWLCRDCINRLLHRRGLPELSPQRYMEIFDFPIVEYYRKAGFDLTRESFEDLGIEFIRDYHARRPECRLQEGAADLLSILKDRGHAQAVLSASEHASLEAALNHFGIRNYFRNVTGIDDHYAAGKIAQGMRWMETHTPPPDRVLLVGDTCHDHHVAEAMGVDCALITAGNHSRERMEPTGRMVFDSLRDFARTLYGAV